MTDITDEEWQKMSPEEKLELQRKNCIFCKIISGEIPAKKVYEDENFIGILDINPGYKGHVLVLPKKHIQIMPQLGTELSGKLGIVSKKISAKIKNAIGSEATSIFVANGAVAGQNAPHFMMHIIPRKKEDEIKLNPELKIIDDKKINDLRKKIITQLGLPDLARTQDYLDEGLNHDKKMSEVKKESEKEDEIKGIDDQKTKKEVKINEVKPDKTLLDKISRMFN